MTFSPAPPVDSLHPSHSAGSDSQGQRLVRRRARLERLPRLHKEELRLQQERAAQLASVSLRVAPGQKADAVAVAYLRDLAKGVGLPDGPYPTAAHVYSTMRRRVERLLGFSTSRPNSPVYVLVLTFDYRDYTGRRHANGGATFSIVDAATPCCYR